MLRKENRYCILTPNYSFTSTVGFTPIICGDTSYQIIQINGHEGYTEIEPKTPSQILLYCIEGSGSIKRPKEEGYCLVNPGEYLPLLRNEGYSRIDLTSSLNHFVMIILTDDFADENLISFDLGKDSLIKKSITGRMSNAIADLLNCNLDQNVKKLYFRAKLMEIYAFYLQQNSITETKFTHQLKAADVAKIDFVKEYIVSNPGTPTTIPQLAKMAGTNSQYLKVHFKLLNNMTIFNYILAKRMEYGKKLILQGELKIAEIASKCGYKQPSHFSNSFKNYFGYLPRILKNHKNSQKLDRTKLKSWHIPTLSILQGVEEWMLNISLGLTV